MHKAVLLLLALLAMAARAFVAPSPLARPAAPVARSAVTMGAAKDGPFTPAVKLARVVLGDQNLGKVRGKAISYHSQYINQFCEECEPPPLTLQSPAPPTSRRAWCTRDRSAPCSPYLRCCWFLNASVPVPPCATSRRAQKDQPGAHQESEDRGQRSRVPELREIRVVEQMRSGGEGVRAHFAPRW